MTNLVCAWELAETSFLGVNTQKNTNLEVTQVRLFVILSENQPAAQDIAELML